MNEIRYPLPDDIDLTEDDVFHKRTSSVLSSIPKKTLPWEMVDYSHSWNIINSNLPDIHVTISGNAFDNLYITDTQLEEWFDDGSIVYESTISSSDWITTQSTTNSSTSVYNGNGISSSFTRSYSTNNLSRLFVKYSNSKNRFKNKITVMKMLELYKDMLFSPNIDDEYDLSISVSDFDLLKAKNKRQEGFNINELKYIDIDTDQFIDIRVQYARHYWNSWYGNPKEEDDDGGINFLKADFSIEELLASEERRVRGVTLMLLPWETTDRHLQTMRGTEENWVNTVV